MPSSCALLQLLRSVGASGDRQLGTLTRMALFAYDNDGISEADLEPLARRTRQSPGRVREAFEIFKSYASAADGRYFLPEAAAYPQERWRQPPATVEAAPVAKKAKPRAKAVEKPKPVEKKVKKVDRNIPETLTPEQRLFERFRTRYDTLFEMPYIPQAKDFVSITRLRKFCASTGWELNEERWDRAVANYLVSDVGMFSVSHLCSPTMFSSLYRAPLDKFGRPKPMTNGAAGAPRLVI